MVNLVIGLICSLVPLAGLIWIQLFLGFLNLNQSNSLFKIKNQLHFDDEHDHWMLALFRQFCPACNLSHWFAYELRPLLWMLENEMRR
ncbi:Kinesin-like protein KIF3B [Trichinella pseudospiralis]